MPGEPSLHRGLELSVTCLREYRWLHDMPAAVKFGEVLPFEHVPVAVQIRLFEVFRQVFERFEILRVALHEDRIVRHPRRDKDVVRRFLAVAVVAVDEQPLDPRGRLWRVSLRATRIISFCGRRT